jgi:nitrite reductase (NADH) large subunit
MKHIIVVGNGMVGYKFCEKFTDKSEAKNFKITVFGEEPRPAYDRVHLSEYFENQDATALEMAPLKWYVNNGIELITNTRVNSIDKQAKTIETIHGNEYAYDYLVLATGSSPFVPNIEGIEKEGVFVYRTIEDLEETIEYANIIKAGRTEKVRAAILGGGLLGLEAAKAVMDMGFEPHVVEFAPKLMPRQLDKRSSNVLQEKIESLGIHVHLSKVTSKILGASAITGMEFGENDQLDVEMLVVSAGIRPRDELAKTCDLKVGTRGGIWVNNKMQTSDDSIFAIGECALFNNMIYGLVAPGYDMAEIAVNQIIGNTEEVMVDEIDMSTKLKLIGVDVASYGEPFMPIDKGYSIIFENKTKGVYKRVNVSLDRKKLLGGILVGDVSDYNMLHQIYLNGLPIPENAEELIVASGGKNAAFGSVLDLPDEAQVCSCESISKGAICSSIIDGGCKSLGDVVTKTKVTTGCGGCKPMVVDLVNETLKSLGEEVKEVICEHFHYSRQELFDLVKVNKIETYEEALEKYGHGHGCEVCKPALASIFATLTMETANKQVTIQDTNDRFLANIQRNGTYSVVPRVPGGEITPQQLITIGEIGAKYDLYTKITGAQRIDLFGAQIHELPLIWKELIAAGFESGHAYGKSLRAVKSCVGSTWCRYGMHESVTFAIEIENRYRGLRAPHKLKGGVSGCIRECAEARGKDFGLIAVEGGWNLYVCGNGGANPKHAILLAEQLSDETAIKYLDRFLMYYIRTAGPLVRTAPWLDKLEGGIEYLKQVIIDDILGIAETLEEEMQALINKYECEWKQAVESPEMMKRFKHFVNTDETNEELVFVPMREQKMPKPW